MSDTAKPKPAEKPSWWKDDYGEWDENHGLAGTAFQEVLGRGFAPTSAEIEGINAWANYIKDNGYAAATAQISLSDEAKARGVDPTKFGNTVLDPATLSEKDKEWYDEWIKGNPNDTFYTGMLDQLHWHQGLYSIDAYRGINDGSITVEGNVYTVTQEAIDRYGNGNIQFKYNPSQATVVRVPTGQIDNVWIQEETTDFGDTPEGMTDEQWSTWQTTQNSGGYTAYMATPEKKSGIGNWVDKQLKHTFHMGRDFRNTAMAVGGVVAAPFTAGVSLTDAAPFVDQNLGIDEAYFATDPLGMNSGLAWGTEGFRRNMEGANRVLGEHGTQIQAVGRGVATTALSVATGGVAGAFIGAAMGATQQFNQAAGGMISWGDAFANAGISAGAAALTFGATSGMESGIATAFTNAGIQGAATIAQSGLATGDWDEAVKQGGVSALASAAASGFTNKMGSQDTFSGALQGAAVGGGTSYLSGLALGTDEDQLAWNAGTAALQGGISGAASAAQRRDFYNKNDQTYVDPVDGKTKTRTQYEAAFERGMSQGPARPRDLPLAAGAGAWERTRRWAGNWNPGKPQITQTRAWDFVTPWATENERRVQAAARDRFDAGVFY